MDNAGFDIRELQADELLAAYSIVRQLRAHLESCDAFAAQVARQRADGYRIAGGFAGEKLVVVAGYRHTCTLSRGPHLFVDDLVTDAAEQGKGYGLAMIAWLRATARDAGLPQVWLDSRSTAVGFYERAGFTFNSAKPCFIAAE